MRHFSSRPRSFLLAQRSNFDDFGSSDGFRWFFMKHIEILMIFENCENNFLSSSEWAIRTTDVLPLVVDVF